MVAAFGILVFKQMRAVKIAQPMLIAGKMTRHPVQKDSDPVLMKRINEKHEILRRPIPACRRKIAE